ncbi:MAG: HAMP domain-containing sensor histidine kinase [Polyangiaceae bacterium]|jgi:signal transduction histidine kinase
MNQAPLRLPAKLAIVQAFVCFATGLLLWAFAPRVLLLAPGIVEGTAPLARVTWGAVTVVVVSATLVATWGLRRTLSRLAVGVAGLQLTDVLALYALPWRLVRLDLAVTSVAALVVLAPPFIPAKDTWLVQLELVLLGVTFAGVAWLGAYVAMRALVVRVTELVPVAVSREAVALLNPAERGARLRRRWQAAVVAPVAFVALASLLLVRAHVLASDQSARVHEAAELVRGVFDVPDAPPASFERARAAALARGFDISVEASSHPFGIETQETGTTCVTVPMDRSSAHVRFLAPRSGRGTIAFTAVALMAIVVAAFLGSRLGAAFADDVSLARRELDATGVADVLRGGRIRGGARFRSVGALLDAADRLGALFREFARAQQRAIDARARTARMRGLFLASMSHDIKAPLNAILGFAELVSRETLTDAQRESVSIIEQRGRELLQLIQTILDVARVEAGELSLSRAWTDVGNVVMQAVLDARGLSIGQHVDISGELQPGLPLMNVDENRLVQALVAITLTAVRFADRGHVLVRAATPPGDRRVGIDVLVTGRQLASADRDRVFEAFDHADRARRHGSLGLGPLLARAIVEMHHGGIDVGTTETGGILFHVWVPVNRENSMPSLSVL